MHKKLFWYLKCFLFWRNDFQLTRPRTHFILYLPPSLPPQGLRGREGPRRHARQERRGGRAGAQGAEGRARKGRTDGREKTAKFKPEGFVNT